MTLQEFYDRIGGDYKATIEPDCPARHSSKSLC